MTPAEEKNLHRRIDDLVSVLKDVQTDIKDSRKEVSDLIKEVKHECKAEILAVKQDHCERLNKHSDSIEKQGEAIIEMKTQNKIYSTFIAIVSNGVFLLFSRLFK